MTDQFQIVTSPTGTVDSKPQRGDLRRNSHAIGIPCRLVVIGALAAVGCGGTEPVGGVVSYAGYSLPTGAVIFQPLNAGDPIRALIQADGRYEARVPVGDYHIGIVANREAQLSSDPKVALMQSPPLPYVPYYFNQPLASGLTAKVVAGPNEIDFDIPAPKPRRRRR